MRFNHTRIRQLENVHVDPFNGSFLSIDQAIKLESSLLSAWQGLQLQILDYHATSFNGAFFIFSTLFSLTTPLFFTTKGSRPIDLKNSDRGYNITVP